MDFKALNIVVVLVGLFFLSTFMSCSKNSDDLSEQDPEKIESEAIKDEDLTEADEDLLKVDYKEFYDALAPHGEWIEITEEDIDVDLKKETASGNGVHRKMSLSRLFGLNNAYADDASFGAFFVWKPSPELAVGVSTGNTAPAVSYVPYTNGQWNYTDAGWYFQAPTPHEEIVHHHGRWAHSPALGWVWVPGRVWAPAWVEWRADEDYVAWTPLPPGIYLADDREMHPRYYEDRYIVVEKKYFMHPHVYKHKHKKSRLIVSQLSPVPGITVVEHNIINRGPDVYVIQNYYPNVIPKVKIERVRTIDKIRHTGNVIYTYAPKFKKYKPGKDIFKPVRKPKNYTSIDNWTAGNKNSGNNNVNKIGQDPWKIDNNAKENVIYKDNSRNQGKDKQKVNNNRKNNEKVKINNRNKGLDKNFKRNDKRNKSNDKVNKERKQNNRDVKINDRGKNKQKNDSKIKQDRNKPGKNKVMGNREKKYDPGKNNSKNNSKSNSKNNSKRENGNNSKDKRK